MQESRIVEGRGGTPQAIIETDEERSYFLIDIPCRQYFAGKQEDLEEIGVKDGVKDGVKELTECQLEILRI